MPPWRTAPERTRPEMDARPSKPLISVVLPTYNERDNLPLILPKIREALEGITHEIIVVDDDSSDGTWELAQQIAGTDDTLRVIRRVNERGLASAILTGFASGRGKYLAVLDADMQHDEAALRGFVEALDGGADLVVGTRYAEGGGMGGWSWHRKLISRTATAMAHWILPNTVSDPMSGFFAMRREFFDTVAHKVNARGFKLLLNFLYHSGARQVAEVGYTFRTRQHGQTKLSGTVILDYLITLYELRFGRLLPLRLVMYCVVGASGVLVNQGGLALGKHGLGLPDDRALMVGIELSVISNFLLNNYWTFKDVKLQGPWALLKGGITFHAVCLAGAVINYAVALWITNQLGFSIYIGNLVGIAFATLWNYFINVNFTWKGAKGE